ncbi:hypothetical protein NCLIV_063540 [Neospora caninum Liverpool]|uniref:Uncharacterized protein n=1 Tax=Neospora caninum (strain Liverpool) TaxID=572307 RepID=F0VQD1_NEOCL|nr:hypothetical protein NCLIV_063540 [Neospora caninum Liverpool]CBZ55928.1 hypothetical protein NCLIV_063540 [Neospora caninum Liverpool]CEL70671.1 TPA: hypothetical protein BN1204_063540 [Neospora caninum Liverpool]|eukprot:XP_003885954.1 hypothetical protein NCLIV_063540 [Neospora caninum Liverpool]
MLRFECRFKRKGRVERKRRKRLSHPVLVGEGGGIPSWFLHSSIYAVERWVYLDVSGVTQLCNAPHSPQNETLLLRHGSVLPPDACLFSLTCKTALTNAGQVPRSSSPPSSSRSSSSSTPSSASAPSSFPSSHSLAIPGPLGLSRSSLLCRCQDFAISSAAPLEDEAWVLFGTDFPPLGLDPGTLDFPSLEDCSASCVRQALSPAGLRRLTSEANRTPCLSAAPREKSAACRPPKDRVSHPHQEPEGSPSSPSGGSLPRQRAAPVELKSHSNHGETAPLGMSCEQNKEDQVMRAETRPAFHSESRNDRLGCFVSPTGDAEGSCLSENPSVDTEADAAFYSPSRWPSPPSSASSAQKFGEADDKEQSIPHRTNAQKGAETRHGNVCMHSSVLKSPRTHPTLCAATELENHQRAEAIENRGNERVGKEGKAESRGTQAGPRSPPVASHTKSDRQGPGSSGDECPKRLYSTSRTAKAEVGNAMGKRCANACGHEGADDGKAEKKETPGGDSVTVRDEADVAKQLNKGDRTDGVVSGEGHGTGVVQPSADCLADTKQRRGCAALQSCQCTTVPVSALFDIHVAEFCRGYRHAGAFGYHNFKKASEESFRFWEAFHGQKWLQRVSSDSEELANGYSASTRLPNPCEEPQSEHAEAKNHAFNECSASRIGSGTQRAIDHENRNHRMAKSGGVTQCARVGCRSPPGGLHPPSVSLRVSKCATALEGRSPGSDKCAKKGEKRWRDRCERIPGLQALGATFEEYAASRQWMFRFCSSLRLPEELVYISVQLMHFLLERWAAWQPPPRVILPRLLETGENAVRPPSVPSQNPRRQHPASQAASCSTAACACGPSDSRSPSSCSRVSPSASAGEEEREVLRILWGVSPAGGEDAGNGDSARFAANSQETHSGRRRTGNSLAGIQPGSGMDAGERMKTGQASFPYPLSPLTRLACVCIAIAYKQLEVVPHLDCAGVVVQAIVFTETEKIEAGKEQKPPARTPLDLPESSPKTHRRQEAGDLWRDPPRQRGNAEERKNRVREQGENHESWLTPHSRQPANEVSREHSDCCSFASSRHTRRTEPSAAVQRSILAHPGDPSAFCCACCQCPAGLSTSSEGDSSPSCSLCSASRAASSSPTLLSSPSSLSASRPFCRLNAHAVPDSERQPHGCVADNKIREDLGEAKSLPASEGKDLPETLHAGKASHGEKPATPAGASVAYRPWPPTGWLELYAWSCIEEDNLLTHANVFLFLQWLLGACKLYRRRYGAAWLAEESADERENDAQGAQGAQGAQCLETDEAAQGLDADAGREKAGTEVEAQRGVDRNGRRKIEKVAEETTRKAPSCTTSLGEDGVLSWAYESEAPSEGGFPERPGKRRYASKRPCATGATRNVEATTSVMFPQSASSEDYPQRYRLQAHSTDPAASHESLRWSAVSVRTPVSPRRPASFPLANSLAAGPPASPLLLPPCPPSASLPVYLLQLCLSSPDASFLSLSPVIQAACVVRFLLLAYRSARKHLQLLEAILGPRIAARVASATTVMKGVLLSAVYRHSLWRWRLPAMVVHALLRNTDDPTRCERCSAGTKRQRARQSEEERERDGKDEETDGTTSSSPCSAARRPRRVGQEEVEPEREKDEERASVPLRLSSSGASHGERKRPAAGEVFVRRDAVKEGTETRRELNPRQVKTRQEGSVNLKVGAAGRTAGRFGKPEEKELPPATCPTPVGQNNERNCGDVQPPADLSTSASLSTDPSVAKARDTTRGCFSHAHGKSSSLNFLPLSSASREGEGGGRKTDFSPERKACTFSPSFSSHSGEDEETETPPPRGERKSRRPFFSRPSGYWSDTADEDAAKANRFQGTKNLTISPHCRWSVAALLCPHGQSRWDLACPECNLSPSSSIHRHFAREKQESGGVENPETSEQKQETVTPLELPGEGSRSSAREEKRKETEDGERERTANSEKNTRYSEGVGGDEEPSATKAGMKAEEGHGGGKRSSECRSEESDMPLPTSTVCNGAKQGRGRGLLLKRQTKRYRRWDVTAAQLLQHARADNEKPRKV